VTAICLTLLVLTTSAAMTDAAPGRPGEEFTMSLIDFAAPEMSAWRPVHDGVMGGVSRGGIAATTEGTALFTGDLSLDNPGGFASVRRRIDGSALADQDGLALRVRGDGRSYQLRLRTDDRFDGAAYRAEFPTEEGRWQTVRLPFASFEPTFRGRILRDAPPLAPGRVRQIAFMLADKQAGPFDLEIAWIAVYGPGDRGDD
jgi:hypothetical protein